MRLNRVKSTLLLVGSIWADKVFAQPAGYAIHAFWLCLVGVLLTYTHRLLFTSGTVVLVSVGLGCWGGGPTYFVVVGTCTNFVACYVVVGVVVGCFNVCSCFRTVCFSN